MAWRRIDVHRAVEQGDIAVLARYLDTGGDPNRKDAEYGAAPVHWAALRGKLDALALLLDNGADLEARTNTDGTALVWGCMGGDARVVRHLLDRGADTFSVTKGKGTALHHATHSGHPEIVNMLLQEGADPRARDNQGERPGDNFDSEVSDGVRRAIATTLVKARREGSSPPPRPTSYRDRADRRSRSRGGRDRGGRSASHGVIGQRTKPSNAVVSNRSSYINGADTGSGNGHYHDPRPKGDQSQLSGGAEGAPRRLSRSVSARLATTPISASAAAAAALARGASRPYRQNSLSMSNGLLEGGEGEVDSDSVLAAAAAAAAVAWSPRFLMLQKNGWGTSAAANASASASASSNGIVLASSSGRGRGSIYDARERDQARAVAPDGEMFENPRLAGVTGIGGGEVAVVAAANGGRNSYRSEVGTASGNSLVIASLGDPQTGKTADDEKLGDLLRQTKNLTLAAEAAAERDIEARNVLRREMTEADQRASEAVRAERARSDGMYALVQALEKRLLEKENRIRVLHAQLQDRDARLRQVGHEVLAEEISTPAVVRGVRRNYEGVISAGGDPQNGSTLASCPPVGGSGASGDSGGGSRSQEASPDRGPAVGPESAPGEAVASGGQDGEASRAGMLAWLRKDRHGTTPKKQPSPPTPAAETQERIGRLYSMIARK